MSDEADRQETAALLAVIPGGRAVIRWFEDNGAPLAFGDGEILCLCLDRNGASRLAIRVGRLFGEATIVFVFDQWIDAHIDGFSHQNVIGGLRLTRPPERRAALWELGVGMIPGDIEILLEPCFGATGVIRARIVRVEFEIASAT